MNVYQLSSIFFTVLAYLTLWKASGVTGYFEIFKSSTTMDYLIVFALFIVVILGVSFITYYLRYLLYIVFLNRSHATRFICTVVLGLVYPKLYVVNYWILIAYAFEESAILLQYAFYERDRLEAIDGQESFFVVKVLIFQSITFVYRDLMAANYVEAATMAIPVTVGLLALLDYKEAWNTLSEWFKGHRNDLMNDVA